MNSLVSASRVALGSGVACLSALCSCSAKSLATSCGVRLAMVVSVVMGGFQELVKPRRNRPVPADLDRPHQDAVARARHDRRARAMLGAACGGFSRLFGRPI